MSGTATVSGTEVFIPWRHHPSRITALQYATNWWKLHGFQTTLIDTDHEPFNLAACRNRAVREARSDVIVIADADTIPEIPALLHAISLASDGHGTVLPYTEYRSLGATGSRQAYAGSPLEDCAHITIPDACSGVYVTTQAGWDRHLGQDEHFQGWGCEDTAWWITHETLIGEPLRVPGAVYALTHESQDKTGEPTIANYARIHHYEQARGNQERILQLAASPT